MTYSSKGEVTTEDPGGDALPLESGCDWGNCDKPGVAWRYEWRNHTWIVVCKACNLKADPS